MKRALLLASLVSLVAVGCVQRLHRILLLMTERVAYRGEKEPVAA